MRDDGVVLLIVAAGERRGLLGVGFENIMTRSWVMTAGTGPGCVSMTGGREDQGARKGNGVRGHRLSSPPCFVQNLLKYLGFSVSMRKVADKHPFCVLIYMNTYIFHICFILFILCHI